MILKEFYPELCIRVIELIARIYKHDEATIGLSKQKRLEYHEQHSTPIMNQLHEFLIHQVGYKTG